MKIIDHRPFKIKIKPEWVKSAKQRAVQQGILNRNIEGIKGVENGMLGEEIIIQYYGAKLVNRYDYDVFMEGFKIDVKTKGCSVTPTENFDCSTQTYFKQNCEAYVFVRVLHDYSTAWIMGGITKEDFHLRKKEWTKGMIDKTNNFQFKDDSWNVYGYQLDPLDILFEKLNDTKL